MIFTVNASLLDAIVLSVVSENDTYGYKITQEVNNIIGVSESTLYPVLRRLQKDNDLEAYDMEYLGRNRRYYKITDKGRILLSLYKEEWEMYKEKIDKVFEKAFGGPKGKTNNAECKTANIGEFIESLKIGEKIENLKIDEKMEFLKNEGIKLGIKLDGFINSQTQKAKAKKSKKNDGEHPDSKTEDKNGDTEE